MRNIRPENFRHACESSDEEAQLYAFWTHSLEGMAAARAGDALKVEACVQALQAIADFFHGQPVAHRALLMADQMEAIVEDRAGSAQDQLPEECVYC